MALIPNVATPQGRKLGERLAHYADQELRNRPDNRCGTCAFRHGEHPANGSPGTLMSALKCLVEGVPFWCHEADRPCAGWRALRLPQGQRFAVPWELVEGYDLPDVIYLPDQSAP